MRDVNAAAQAVRESRVSRGERWVVWIKAKDLSGDQAHFGFWTGTYEAKIATPDMVDAATYNRTFHGAGGLLGVGEIRCGLGLEFKPVTVTLSSASPEAIDAARLYDARGAGLQIWRATMQGPAIVGVEGVFSGAVDTLTDEIGPDGFGRISLQAVSSARRLSIARPILASSESQFLRDPDDEAMNNSTSVGSLSPPWGTKITAAGS